jgi:hypothetical protein
MKHNPDFGAGVPWPILLPMQQAVYVRPKDDRWLDISLLTGEDSWGKSFAAVFYLLRQLITFPNSRALAIMPHSRFFHDVAKDLGPLK